MSNSSCPGNTSAGTLTDLQTKGGASKFLTEKPEVTYFRSLWSRHSKFAMENIRNTFHNQVSFGQDSTLTLGRNGDLVHWQYAVYDLPALRAVTPTADQLAMNAYGFGATAFPACDACDPANDGPLEALACNALPGPGVISSLPDEDPGFVDDSIDLCTGLTRPWAHYTNAVGHVITRKACFTLGGQQIQMLTAEFLNAWEELTGKAGKRLSEMIGKRLTRSQLVEDAQFAQRLYVPLPFYYTQHPGNAFNSVGSMFMPAQVQICFEDLQKLIQVSDPGTLVVKGDTCAPIGSNDLRAHLDSTYIFLDKCERERFARGCFDQLIHQVQHHTTCSKQCQLRINLGFNHPVFELIFYVRRRAQSMCNNHLNFSGIHGKDPIKSVYLKLNGAPRFSPTEGRYFRLVQPYQHHSHIPASYIYSYSMALNPEDSVQPSGSLNMSLIDTAELHLELQDGLSDEDVDVFVHGISWNILSTANQMTLLRLQ